MPADVGAAELRREIRILAVRLLDAAPARVPRDVEHRRERRAGTDRQHPPPDRGRDRLDQLGVERGRRPDRLLERRRLAGEQAVEGLLVEDRGDAESGLLDEEPLDGVARFGGSDRVEIRRAGDPADVTDPLGEAGANALGIELGLGAEQLERPHGAELGDLLLERHPDEQVRDARVDRQGRVAIGDLGRRHRPLSPSPSRWSGR